MIKERKEKSNCIMLGFPEYRQQAKKLAELTDITYADIQIHRFPDGESKITLPVELIQTHNHVIIYRSLDDPNEKLVELLLVAEGARKLGARKLTFVVPYLAYMRQDKAFKPGEVVSQKIIGKLLAETFDGVLTVDSHLHRIHHLSEAIPVRLAVNLNATKPMAHFIENKFENPFLLGPDEESRQWVEAIALHFSKSKDMDFAVATKMRLGDQDVKIRLPDRDYSGRNIILVDDVASSGQTLIQAARQLSQYQPQSVSVLVTHALFMKGSIEQIHDAGVRNIWSCNSINHPSNRVSLTPLLAENLGQFIS